MTLIREIMTPSPETISADATIREAALRMQEADIGALPVVDHNSLRGFITDRDIAVRAVAQSRDPSTTRVADVMSSSLIFCYDDQDIRDAAREMEANQVRRLLVMDRDERCCGILSQADVALRSHDPNLTAEVVERVSEPAHREPTH